MTLHGTLSFLPEPRGIFAYIDGDPASWLDKRNRPGTTSANALEAVTASAARLHRSMFIGTAH